MPGGLPDGAVVHPPELRIDCMTDYLKSNDSSAILLLCGVFGPDTDPSVKPLSLGEYNRTATWLNNRKLRPQDILRDEIIEQLRLDPIPDLPTSRIESLLARGAGLAFALERWQNKGIWVLCRCDETYPRKLRTHLNQHAPAVLFGIGDKKLVGVGGLAIVGSRDIDDSAAEFARDIARHAANLGLNVISGGAKGVDRIAMNAAIENGGRAVGVLADHLLKASVSPETRDLIRSGALTLITPYHPESSWSVPNAMNRNKLIYGLSDYAVVVSSDLNKGGTWAGATEELRRDHHIPVLVRIADDVPKGNPALVAKGAVPLPSPGEFNSALEATVSPIQPDLFGSSA